MKPIRAILISSVLVLAVGCQGDVPSKDQTTKANATKANATETNALADLTVEASCGECQFGMPGEGCDLAIRVDGKTYYVDGSSIDDHGDAHGEQGLCNCIRKAVVSGEIVGGRFKSTSFKLLPYEKKE